jgi:hypothetical protein
MVSVAGNLMMRRSIYRTKHLSPNAPNREAPEPRREEQQAADPQKRHLSTEARQEPELLDSRGLGATEELLVG